jgi:uncharacterized membrane protein SirB2
VDFVDVVNLVKLELFYLYIDPISSFNDFMFDDFTKLLPHFYDSFLLFFGVQILMNSKNLLVLRF